MSGVSPLNSKSQTDWNKCFLCRTEKKREYLKSPPTHYSFIKNNDGYYMIATNIPFFQGIDQLPIILDPIILDEGGSTEETLRRNNAKYHQNCRLLFNNTMLERTRKTAASSNISSDDGKARLEELAFKVICVFMQERKFNI
jgi:hypothetical protein